MTQASTMKYIATAAVVAIGALTQAHAALAPAFKVNTTLFDGVPNHKDFTANSLSGNASSLLTVDAPNLDISGKGWTQFTAFSDISGSMPSGGPSARATNLNNTYLIWAEYTFNTHYVSGNFASVNSSYAVTALTFTIYGEAFGGGDSVFSTADVGNAGSGTVVHSGDTKTLGSGVLLGGVSTINGSGGTSFNTHMKLTLTADGKSFFYEPDPFYTFAFSSFTNTQQGFVPDANGRVAINSAQGGADFNNVPEPAALALVALGLVAAGAATKRRKN